MPELPDVEVFRRTIARTSLHRRIGQVRVLDTRMLHGTTRSGLSKRLRGHVLVATHRHGKHLVADLDPGGDILILHFGMTGYPATGEGSPEPDKHARVVFGFDDGHWLVLVDQRRLGRVAVADSLEDYVAGEGLGPDALSLTPTQLREVMRTSRAGVKATLMDQSRIAGLGNIYTDEVLFQARVDPRGRARSLDDAACRRLHRQLHRVVEVAVERQADPDRLPRGWLLPNREDGAACPRGNGSVRTFRSGGRTGYWCPACQGR